MSNKGAAAAGGARGDETQASTGGGQGGIAGTVLVPGPSGPTRQSARRPKLLPAILSNPLVCLFVGSNPTHHEGPPKIRRSAHQGKYRLVADRVGFEPTNTREDVTGFPIQRLRPLGHLSNYSGTYAHSFERFRTRPPHGADGVRIIHVQACGGACFGTLNGG